MLMTLRRLTLAALAAGAALVSCSAPAHAATLNVANTDACDQATLTQPFASYGDNNYYKLMPGGDFTSGGVGWTLNGGAQVVTGSGPNGGNALYLPAGATVTSPDTCVDAAYPTMRMFADSLTSNADVSVSVVYTVAQGTVTVPVGTISQTNGWQPTATMRTGGSIAGALSGGVAQMSLSFTSLSGTTDISDVFVDPRMGY
jgi:hypothetical protein